VVDALSQEELEAAYCWEESDRVPGKPELTEFRRALRHHQARWREAHGHPIGSQPLVPRPGGQSRPVGSRLPLPYARETGATFLTPAAREAAEARTAFVEPHQSLDHQRLWAELLWPATLAFNLFGDLAADLALADRAVRAWWPDVPGTVSGVRFAHSPGRLDPEWLGNLVDFHAAFVLDLGDGSRGIVGVVTAYQDVNRRQPPKPTRLPRYREVTDRSRLFRPEALDGVNGTELIHLWLDHLLVLSMLQHGSREWHWGRLVVVHPAGNTDFADACGRYRALLRDDATFTSSTIEALLATGVLPRATDAALRERYVLGGDR
jgi:hypothetical protein